MEYLVRTYELNEWMNERVNALHLLLLPLHMFWERERGSTAESIDVCGWIRIMRKKEWVAKCTTGWDPYIIGFFLTEAEPGGTWGSYGGGEGWHNEKGFWVWVSLCSLTL